MLDEILVACCATLHTYTATILDAVLGQRGTLDISHMRDGDNHILISIEILGIELLRRVNDLGAALVAILGLDLQQLVLDDLHLHIDACQYILKVVDLALQLGVLGLQFLALQTCKLTQTHLNDSSCLHITQTKTLLQSLLGCIGRA